jgi:hypothetical protein
MTELHVVPNTETEPDLTDPERKEDPFKPWTTEQLVAAKRPPEWLAKGLIMAPTYGIMAGPEKSLKSYIAQIIAVGIAAGKPILGTFAVSKAESVLMFVGEGGRLPYTGRLERIASAYGVRLEDLPIVTSFGIAPIPMDSFRKPFTSLVQEIEPALVILEPLYAYHGSASKGSMLYEEGDQLSYLSHVTEDRGISLIIGTHFNQTGKGRGLTRITGAGGAEWSDSWWIVVKGDSCDVSAGHFEIEFDVGSRQWGGTEWDLVIDLGAYDADAMDHCGEIIWHMERVDGGRKNKNAIPIEDQIIRIVTKHPFEYTESQIVTKCYGTADDIRKMFHAVEDAGDIVCQKTPRSDIRGRTRQFDCYGPRPLSEAQKRIAGLL